MRARKSFGGVSATFMLVEFAPYRKVCLESSMTTHATHATQHNTTQHNTAQHNTKQHSTTQHRKNTKHKKQNTAQRSAAQRSAAQRSAAQRSTAQHKHNNITHRTTHMNRYTGAGEAVKWTRKREAQRKSEGQTQEKHWV